MALRKTTLAVDDDSIAQASEVLATQGIEDTIDAALRSALVPEARHRAMERLRSMDGLDLDKPDVMAAAWKD